jgi:hypothetical protein
MIRIQKLTSIEMTHALVAADDQQQPIVTYYHHEQETYIVTSSSFNHSSGIMKYLKFEWTCINCYKMFGEQVKLHAHLYVSSFATQSDLLSIGV